MAPGLGSRLRHLLHLIHADLDPEAQQYPEISEAVCELDKVVQEFPPARFAGPGQSEVARFPEGRQAQEPVEVGPERSEAGRVGIAEVQAGQAVIEAEQDDSRIPLEGCAVVPGDLCSFLLSRLAGLGGFGGSLAAAGPPSLPFAMPLRKS